jgi:hypothetical protein
MPIEQYETEPASLRCFAQLVLRDEIGSDHLSRYVQELLEFRLTELPAICRQEARLLTSRRLGLGAREVAHLLCHQVDQM